MAPNLSTIRRSEVPCVPVPAEPTLYTALRNLVRGQPEGEPKLNMAKRLENAHIALERAELAAKQGTNPKVRP